MLSRNVTDCSNLQLFHLPKHHLRGTVMGWRPSLGLVRGLHSKRPALEEAESGEPKGGGNRLAGF